MIVAEPPDRTAFPAAEVFAATDGPQVVIIIAAGCQVRRPDFAALFDFVICEGRDDFGIAREWLQGCIGWLFVVGGLRPGILTFSATLEVQNIVTEEMAQIDTSFTGAAIAAAAMESTIMVVRIVVKFSDDDSLSQRRVPLAFAEPVR